MSTPINREALVASLIAAIETSSEPLNLFRDEDFVPDEVGEWVKLQDGSWTTWRRELQDMMNLKWTPSLYKERSKHFSSIQSAYRMVTTYEHQLVRYAEERADQIIAGSTRPAKQEHPDADVTPGAP